MPSAAGYGDHRDLHKALVVGDGAAGIADGARAAGVPDVRLTAGHDDAAAWVVENAAPGDVVLVKASRAAALERVADRVLEGEDAST